ncbi:MAG TPA: hypothetical protein VGG92_04180 [Caulobacteraceae bacterium]|jgi:hypothetical protein
MDVADDTPNTEEACALEVLDLIQAMARASSAADSVVLARQARLLLHGFDPLDAPGVVAPLTAAGATLDDCRRLLAPP